MVVAMEQIVEVVQIAEVVLVFFYVNSCGDDCGIVLGGGCLIFRSECTIWRL